MLGACSFGLKVTIASALYNGIAALCLAPLQARSHARNAGLYYLLIENAAKSIASNVTGSRRKSEAAAQSRFDDAVKNADIDYHQADKAVRRKHCKRKLSSRDSDRVQIRQLLSDRVQKRQQLHTANAASRGQSSSQAIASFSCSGTLTAVIGALAAHQTRC
eukprot:4738-Heterococcus_DN1.PRE.3